MGVKDLWNILSPLCDRKPLFELQGKTIAIDLSCWIVDSQSVANNTVQPRMYLRNLFFRTAFLLMEGISPVFVLEGAPPALKQNTIAKRNDIRHGLRERKTSRTTDRTQFKRVLKECKKMLEYMGLACVQGHGEAEAMCAYLNEDGLVDGCISQDSDCFLYGAKVVYRNFCTSAQGNSGGSNGAVDEYSMEKIERILELGRNKMIALALLCGCDYDPGVNGVGKEAVLKLFKIVGEGVILDRIKNWANDKSFERLEAELLDPSKCTSCGHSGKLQKHNKSGCTECGTVTKCSTDYKEKRTLLMNEITLRKKALLTGNFPNIELIEEFLIRKHDVPSQVDIQWKQPRINEFVLFVENYLQWEPEYAFEKIFPLATRWQILHLPNISSETRLSMKNLFIPEKIKKIRNIRSIASYEIIWQSNYLLIEQLDMYINSDKENDDERNIKELTSIEPQEAALKCYPEIVEAFEAIRNAKSKKRPGTLRAKRTARNKDEHSVEEQNKPVRQKRNAKKTQAKNNRKIDEYISRKEPLSLEESFEKMTITPKRSKIASGRPSPLTSSKEVNKECNNILNGKIKRGPQFERLLETEEKGSNLNNTLDRMFNELSPDDFLSDAEEHDLNMSEIIDRVCSMRPLHFNYMNVPETIVEDEVISNNSDRRSNVYKACRVNNDNPCKEKLELRKSKDSTKIEDMQEKVTDDTIDEFGDTEEYIPLNERLQQKAKKCSKIWNDVLLPSNNATNHRFSLGFDALMNETNGAEASFGSS